MEPHGLAVDGAGNIYFADAWAHRVRKVDMASGLISTVAGTGVSGYNGDGVQASNATLSFPTGVACDVLGNLYISESWSHRVRKVDAKSGLISTVAGTGSGSYNGDGKLATTATLGSPYGVAVGVAGNIYIADTWNYRIRKVVIQPVVAGRCFVAPNVVDFSRGPAKVTIGVKDAKPGGTVEFTLYNQAGMPVLKIREKAVVGGNGAAAVSFDGMDGGKPLPSGIYYVVASGAVSARAKMLVWTRYVSSLGGK
jgi:hypothetical protein